MNITVEIHYSTHGAKSSQQATLPLKGRKPEKVALEWWKYIKMEMSYHAQLVKVIVDGDKDITHPVKDLEDLEWNNTLNDDLPF